MIYKINKTSIQAKQFLIKNKRNLYKIYYTNFHKKMSNQSINKSIRFFAFFEIMDYNLLHLFKNITMTIQTEERLPLVAIKDLTRGYPDSKKPLFKKLNFELFK